MIGASPLSSACAPSTEMSTPVDPTRCDYIKTPGAGLLVPASPAAARTQLAPPEKRRPGLNVPKPLNKPVGWAIVGLGQLALAEVMPAFRETKLARPVALVSGHPE